MRLSNCFYKLNRGKPLFSEAEMKEIRAIANQNIGKISMEQAEKFAVKTMLDEAIAERNGILELVHEAMGLPAPAKTSESGSAKPTTTNQSRFDNQADTQFANNKIFTQSAVDAARARLKKKLGSLNSGIDPELLQDGMVLAGAHIEAGARSFAAYSKAMIEDLGDAIKPYLRSLYESVRHYPGLNTDGMTGSADIDAIATIQEKIKPETNKSLDQGAHFAADRKDEYKSVEHLGIDKQGAKAQDVLIGGTENARPTLTESVPGESAQSDTGAKSGRYRAGESLDAGLAGQGEGADSGEAVSGGVRVPSGSGTQYTGNTEGLHPSGAARTDGVVRSTSVSTDVGLADHVITDANEIGSGGLVKKFRDNVAAIKILKLLDTESRPATPDERKTLARYVGFGALKSVFDKNSKQWKAQYAELRELLNDEEYESARASVLNAHYTSKPVVDSMFSAVRRLGFIGGRFLEPSAGSGNFFGMMPTDIRNASILHGVELDLLTSKLLKAIYPKANIAIATGFQHYQVPVGYFDIAMGNPPFGSEPIIDRERSEYSGFSIHNYFIARMIDKVRDGGIVPVIVSHNFMDAINPKTREWIAKRANLIAAVRLPNTAFKGNAGTEVVTDILFLQKTATPEKSPAWINASDIVVPAPKGGESTTASVNVYFQRNKQNILGKETTAGSMYRANEYTVEPTGDLTKQLAGFVASIPENIYKPVERTINELDSTDNTIPAGVKQGSYFITDKGEVKQRGQDIAGSQTSTAWEPKNNTAMARMKGMISLRNLLRTQMRMERDEKNGVKMIESHRKVLSKAYDDFFKKYGYVNSQVNRNIFMDDTEYALLQAIEFDYDKGVSKAVALRNGMEERAPSAQKADILTRRVLFPFAEQMNVTSANDALLSSLDAKGRVDLEYMERAYGKSQKEIIEELGDMLYLDPTTGDPVMSDEYLSGDVKTKLAAAKKSADENHAYSRNVIALEKVIPSDKLPSEIYASLGAGWIPADIFKQFATEITGSSKIDLTYLAATAQWLGHINDSGDVGKMSNDYGTKDLTSFDLLKLMMNGKAPEVKMKTVRDGKEVFVTDTEATEAAREKVNKIKQAWESWVWNDGVRAEKLAELFNEKYNRTVNRKYNGDHLVLHGSNPAIVLRKHQKSAVWRGIQDRNLLLDHAVGAGKTFVGTAIIMEYKRLGIARKPILVVPNHLTTQWRSEFARMYPAANVLAANPEDFSKANRQRMFSKIALGEYDAVIIGHSSLTKIGLDPTIEKDIYKEQIDEITNAIEAIKSERGDRGIVRDMEKIRANLEAKVEKLALLAGERDKVVTFDELGIDGLFVDEMHEFKNLFFSTQMQRVSGLGNPKGSGKAFDLFAKVRWLTKTYGEKVPLITATGTPVSNSLSEMFTMQRYMKYDEMKRDGLHLFDSWARMYGDVESLYEVAPSGVGYRISQRFSKFKNLPSLMAHYHTFADTVTLQDLKDQAKEAGKVFPVPKIASGKPENIVAQRSTAQRDFFGAPTVRRDESGKVLFAMDATKAKIEQSNDAKWILSDGHTSNSYDTKEDAELALVEKSLTPVLYLDPDSLLGQFSNLAQLTRETKGKINALSLTSLASKAGLDMRIINPNAEDFAGSKINKAVDKMMDVYQKWSKDKGTQLVFCDTSIPLSARSALGNKDRRLFVLDDQGMLTHKNGTLHTIKGFEGFPFYLVRTIDRGSPSISIYDPVTGLRIKGDMANKGEAKDWLADLLSKDANRDKWYEARESKEPITAERMAEYRAENDLELAEDGSNEVGMEDIEGVSGDSQFSVYDDIKGKLVARGVPENQIAFIHDYDTPAKKQSLFKSVNRGDVRFLFGSTPKLGAGTNVQERLVGLHHIDAPWRPSDLEQREGRIIRQGNMLYARDPDGFEVFIGRYATEQTYDTRRWQLLEHKASGIEQLRKYSGQIEIEDVAGEAANSADMKAAASGNPLILEETKMHTEVKRLTALQKAYSDGKYAMQRKLSHERNRVSEWLPARIQAIETQMAAARAIPVTIEKGKVVPVVIDGKTITDKEKAETKIAEAVTMVRTGFTKSKDIYYRGVKFTLKAMWAAGLVEIESSIGTVASYGAKDVISPSGMLTRFANYIDSLAQRKERVQLDLELAKKDIASIEARIDKPFDGIAALAAAQQNHGLVQRRLMKSTQIDAVPVEERAAFTAEIAERKKVLEELGYGTALKEMNSDDAPLASVANKAQSDSYEVQPNTTRNLPIDAATLVELRRAAAGIESAERGITFTINANGKAIVTGPARVNVPARFQRFANEHGLTLVVQRADSKGGFVNSNTPMPIAYREAGALYFGEIGASHIDRTGMTRFSKTEQANLTPQTVDSIKQATAKLRASWHGFKRVIIVQSVKEIPNELYLRALRVGKPIGQHSEGIYDPKTYTVYLVADNIASPERSVWVAVHEVVGHGGIRMLGSPVVGALSYAAKNGFVTKLAKAIAMDRGETFNAMTHTDEAIAELAAATITGNVDAILERYGVKVPIVMRSNLLSMIGRVVDAVRQFISRVTGRPVTEVSDGGVLRLIRRMKDAVEGNKAHGYDTPAVSQVALASTNVKPTLKSDILSDYWLNEKRAITTDAGRNEYGAYKRFGAVTGRFTAPVSVPLKALQSLPGLRGEQGKVRQGDLDWLLRRMGETGSLPTLENGKPEVPYIEVDQDGKAWISEGNHRIMAAARLGWETLPVEIRYFNGGERINGALNPIKIIEGYDAAGVSQGALASRKRTGKTEFFKWTKKTVPLDTVFGEINKHKHEMLNGFMVVDNYYMTVGVLPDGRYQLTYLPPWGGNRNSFFAISSDLTDLITSSLSHLERSDNAIARAKNSAYKNSLIGKLEERFGDVFSFAHSTQSKSEYIIHNPSGTKIRISDHNLPLHYEQADIDLRTTQSTEDKFSEIEAYLDDREEIAAPAQSSIPGTAKPHDQPPLQNNLGLEGGQPHSRATWDSIKPSMFDNLDYKLHDKHVDMKRVIEAIKSTGIKVTENVNAYLREELFHGRASKRTQDFILTELNPILEQMQKDGLSSDSLDEYLHARHAPEANALAQSRNPTKVELDALIAKYSAQRDSLFNNADVTKYLDVRARLLRAKSDVLVGEADDSLVSILEGRLAKLKKSSTDINEYLNAVYQVRELGYVTPFVGDNTALSGMSNRQAAEYMKALPIAQKNKLNTAAQKVDAIIAKTRDLYVDYSLVPKDQVDSWAEMFRYYVPLMREDHDGYMGIGQGFSIKGKEVKHRTGSTAKVIDILANVAMQREKAIVRGEKNRVAAALVGLAEQNPNEEFWSVGDIPKERVLNERTGLIEERIDPTFKNHENVVVAKVVDSQGNVVERAIIFNKHNDRAIRMAVAIKNLDAIHLGELLSASAKITRYFASINTQYNPVFGLTNFVRDTQGLLLNLSSTPIANKRVDVLKNIPSALIGIYTDMRAERKGHAATSKWAVLWEELQNEGGMTGYRDLYANSEDRANAIKHALDPHAWQDSQLGKIFTAGGMLKVPMSIAQNKAAWLFNWLSDYNQTAEGATRLAAYKVARDNGMSKSEAASLAKNITVNFNRKGEIGQQAGSLYAFFNAAAQGTARIGETLFKMEGGDIKTLRLSGAGKNIIIGGITLGVMQALMLAAAGFDDDQPPQFIRERSLILPIGDGKYLTLPMPLGFHAIPNIGRILTEFTLSGFDRPGDRLTQLFAVFADAFNPIGSSGISMQTLAPTALDPFAALAENKDWTGKTIYKPDFNSLDPTPGFTRNKNTASLWSKFLAEAINTVSGGDDYKVGVFSPTADSIDYLTSQATGGVGREISKAFQGAESVVTGEHLPSYKIPLVGRFYGNAEDQSSQGGRYYANIMRINEAENGLKGRMQDHLPVDEFMADNPEYKLIGRAKFTETIIKNLRKQKKILIENNATREQIAVIEDRITLAMKRLNDATKALSKDAGT